MLDAVAVKAPRGPVRDVDGALVRALRYELGLSLMDFGSLVGKEKVTVYRWEVGGIDEILWLGLLSKAGRKASWQPEPSTLIRATSEVADLREAAAARPQKKRYRKARHCGRGRACAEGSAAPPQLVDVDDGRGAG